MRSLYQGSQYFGPLVGAPDFWKLPSKYHKALDKSTWGGLGSELAFRDSALAGCSSNEAGDTEQVRLGGL